jgi:hypothetical protein
MGSHYFCDLGAPEPDGQTHWCFPVVSSPMGIRTVCEKRFHSEDGNRRIPKQNTSVKERTAIFLTNYIHIDASIQSQFSKLDSYLSQIRFRHKARRRDESLFALVRISARQQLEEPILDWCETLSNFWGKRRIGSMKVG